MESRRRILFWGLAAAYGAGIFALSSLPPPEVANSAAVLVGDQVLHAIEFGVFALLLALAIGTAPSPRARRLASLFAFLGASAYAVVDEVHQSLVPSRQGDPLDVVADVVGAAIAASLYLAWTVRAVPSAGAADPP